MNRFAIDEDAGFEITILELGSCSVGMSDPKHSKYNDFDDKRQEKGIGHVVFFYLC